ncbi:MAG: hypothetical protein H0X45_01840 [Planctomycetes bacterium]|nr:hypothetical protein [Planctomycetota bacterium]
MNRTASSRRAGILVTVVGLSALLLGLCLAFIMRMRSDADEARGFLLQAQARAMLTAALQYIAETSRLGWDDPATPAHEEAFGWIDVRDGSPGPKDHFNRQLGGIASDGSGPAFPALGAAARCPMYVMKRPPCAVETRSEYNPLPDVGAPFVDWRTAISYRNLEPLPVEATPAASLTQRFQEWSAGDTAPRRGREAKAWFRIYRATREDCDAHRDLKGDLSPIAWSPAVFFVTCGAGATRGFKDWPEVVASGDEAIFAGDRWLFDGLRADEVIIRFACEWHPAVTGETWNHHRHGGDFILPPTNQPDRDSGATNRCAPKSFGGNFLWIERLASYVPDRW